MPLTTDRDKKRATDLNSAMHSFITEFLSKKPCKGKLNIITLPLSGDRNVIIAMFLQHQHAPSSLHAFSEITINTSQT